MKYACPHCGCVYEGTIIKTYWEMDCSHLTYLPIHNVGIEYGFSCPHCEHFKSVGIKIMYTRTNKKDSWRKFWDEKVDSRFTEGFTILDVPTWKTDKMIKPIKDIQTKH